MQHKRWTEDQLIAAVAESETIAQVLRKLKLSSSPGNYRTFHNYIRKLGLDISHFTGQAHGTSRTPGTKSLQERLQPHTDPVKLKRRILKEGLLVNVCSICGQEPEWNGSPLTLQMDHINGDPTDNRIENLRILCPNCHTQTETFVRKKLKGRYALPGNKCTDCDSPISARATRCRYCEGKRHVQTKIKWPRPQYIRELLDQTSYEAIGRKLGVSGNAVKKYLLRTTGEAPRKHKK